MGFPVLFFLIALGWSVSARLNQLTLYGAFVPGVISLVVIVGVFYSFYPARLVRAQVLSLREQEFVEAARMIGAPDVRIMRKHLLPHVAGSLIVYASQLMALTIFLEAALSILGVGIGLPDASWGNLISANYGTLLVPGGPHAYTDTLFVRTTYLTTLWPALLVVLTVVAFTLFGEGVRNALDPRARRT
jgi:peptide/nickel transport system permease protein